MWIIIGIAFLLGGIFTLTLNELPKKKWPLIAVWTLWIVFGIAIEINWRAQPKDKHTCSHTFCPYEGLTSEDYKRNPELCECEEGSDCYYLDLLHFKYPKKSYDELDSLLFQPKP